eukprot:TRINITY_DN48878_c0_g1_i1.p1 TRINITY_DN48878_c0_g1~~TRINITY_DN48878_c0_g1_i1.p1  ORF type:complete len:232 (-),score=37.32 TRINITY_DN48878_c0_g1_i1:337-1032(-)
MSVSRTQLFLDRIVPLQKTRWAFLGFCLFLFCLRVYSAQGFYCQAYALALELLSVAIDFFSPAEDPELAAANEEPDLLPTSTRPATSTSATIAASTSATPGRGGLSRTTGAPTSGSGSTGPVTHEPEYRPFRRKSGEFKSWKHAMQSTLIFSFLSSFEMLNIEVYVPLLVMYFVLLFSFTVYRRVEHMRKYKYTPWSAPKPSYTADGGKLYEQKTAKGSAPAPLAKKKALD